MNLVVDCSFIMSCILPDEMNNNSIKYELYEIYAPAVFYLECNNMLLNALSRKRIMESDCKEYLAIIQELPITIDKFSCTPEFLHSIAKLAIEHNITSYDATYLELAMRLNARIATFDKSLIKACVRHQIEVENILV